MWVKDKKQNDCHCLGGDVLIGRNCAAGQSTRSFMGSRMVRILSSVALLSLSKCSLASSDELFLALANNFIAYFCLWLQEIGAPCRALLALKCI